MDHVNILRQLQLGTTLLSRQKAALDEHAKIAAARDAALEAGLESLVPKLIDRGLCRPEHVERLKQAMRTPTGAVEVIGAILEETKPGQAPVQVGKSAVKSASKTAMSVNRAALLQELTQQHLGGVA